MGELTVPDGSPPMKRSRSDQGPALPSRTLCGPRDEESEALARQAAITLTEEAYEAPAQLTDGHGEDEHDAESTTSSAFEDAMDDAEDRPYRPQAEGDVGLNADERRDVLLRVRKIGALRFLEEEVTNGKYSVRQLLTAFGVRPDLPFSDSWHFRLLGLCVQREVRRRQKLPQYNTVDDAVALLQKSKHIMVITGAGISTSLGIPDFRSKHTGFYSQLQELGYSEPEEVFDLNLFDENPTTFYQLARGILPITDRCSTTHAFVKLLQDKNKLLTNYSQNIDNVEQIAGIDKEKLIQCHGSWATAKCRTCGHEVDGKEIFADVQAQRVAKCKVCLDGLKVKQPKKRKRGSANSSRSRKSEFSDDDEDGEYDIPQAGVMKPGITFFHEQLPNTFFDRLIDHDRDLVDLVVVIGTSMKVSPVNQIPNFVAADVPHLYISREPVGHINFDVQLLGYCDDVVSELARRAGWIIEHENYEGERRADVRDYEENATGHHWCIDIPGKEHTVEETNDPGS